MIDSWKLEGGIKPAVPGHWHPRCLLPSSSPSSPWPLSPRPLANSPRPKDTVAAAASKCINLYFFSLFCTIRWPLGGEGLLPSVGVGRAGGVAVGAAAGVARGRVVHLGAAVAAGGGAAHLEGRADLLLGVLAEKIELEGKDRGSSIYFRVISRSPG